ncbi:MAG: histidine phosphatase family protein [Propionibacteriaceae bacterium]|nr:histidine phosphatase family protein [Propionibacteriaceae bacterium]
MRLYLVRHGRTPSNVARLLDTAVPGADLDAAGREQAAGLVERLAGHDLEAVFASDLVRTQQTVAPLAADRGLEVTILGGLREIQAGEDEMSPLWERYVGALRSWGEGDLAACVPGGEDADAFYGRYDAAIAEIAAAGHGTALLVSHGAALRMWIAARVQGIDLAEVVGRRLGNTTIVTLDGSPEEGWTFVDWDEIDEPEEWPAAPTPTPELVELTRTEASAEAPGWRLLLGSLHQTTDWPTFADALTFVTAVAEIAEDLGHHPDVDLRYSRVHLAVRTHDVGAVTPLDIALANRISVLVHQHGGRPVVDALTQVEIAIDTLDADAILPFWEAVLGYERDGDDALVDPERRGPQVWFQRLDEPRPVRNRIHLDVTVAHDVAEQRIAAALASGGRVVSDAQAPAFTILADADGNEACICTWQGRDPDPVD